jgi:hypothetical protein
LLMRTLVEMSGDKEKLSYYFKELK